MRKDLRSFLCIAAAELISFGPYLFQRGFYSDDWIFLYLGYRSNGLLEAVLTKIRSSWIRPVSALHYPLLFALGGLHPAFYQAAMLGLKIVEGYLLFLLLKRLLGWSELALCAATLALAYPNRYATHLWFANSLQDTAIVLALGSLLFQEARVRTRRTRWLAASLGCYLAGILTYEAVALLPLALGVALAVRSILSGVPSRKALASAGRGLLPYAAVFAAGFGWMWWGADVVFSQANPKPIVLSFGKAWTVYARGLACLTTRTLSLCYAGALHMRRELPFPLLSLAAVSVAALGYWVKLGERAAKPSLPQALPTALALGAGFFVAGYTPYAFSQLDYIPDVFGVLNRVNGIGAWSGAILAAAGLASLSRRHPAAGRSLFAVILAAFVVTNCLICKQWAAAWGFERDILEKVVARADSLPPSATLILTDAPTMVGGAPVFTESRDFDFALKIWSRRDDLSGRLVTRRMRFEKDFVAERPSAADWPRTEDRRYPYGRGVFLYRYQKDKLERLAGPVPGAQIIYSSSGEGAPKG